ncbi:retrotransposon protein, putative, ty1-copia subclass [Tanacetum coccineum]
MTTSSANNSVLRASSSIKILRRTQLNCWYDILGMYYSIKDRVELPRAAIPPAPGVGSWVQKGKKHNKSQPQKAAKGQNQGNGKNKHAYASKPKIPPPPRGKNPAKDTICQSVVRQETELEEELSSSLRASRKLKPGLLAVRGPMSNVKLWTAIYFQKEVENQLCKTIKSLRSDHGGEYMSQEFLDHLKDHVIIAHRTPPYTPQHNGVSRVETDPELDMVRSMMRSNNSSKSFWDYALETAARNLNMVPTKKVEKTPYKVWHGQAPKLSYLKVWGYFVSTCLTRYFFTSPKDKLEPSALLDPESDKWLNAMNVEMQSMKDNEVWVLVELPPNGKTVGSKWLFKKKTDIKEHDTPIKLVLWGRANSNLPLLFDLRKPSHLPIIYRENHKADFHMENSKRGSMPMQDKLRLSKSQGASTPAELKRMQNVPYAQLWVIMVSPCFTNAGYLTDADDLKSQTRYVFVLNGVLLTGRLPAKHIPLLHLQHFRAKVHYLLEVIEYGDIKLEKVHTDDNLADHLQKRWLFQSIQNLLGILECFQLVVFMKSVL